MARLSSKQGGVRVVGTWGLQTRASMVTRTDPALSLPPTSPTPIHACTPPILRPADPDFVNLAECHFGMCILTLLRAKKVDPLEKPAILVKALNHYKQVGLPPPTLFLCSVACVWWWGVGRVQTGDGNVVDVEMLSSWSRQ